MSSEVNKGNHNEVNSSPTYVNKFPELLSYYIFVAIRYVLKYILLKVPFWQSLRNIMFTLLNILLDVSLSDT